MKINKLILAGLLALVLFSCKKNADPSDDDLGYSYCPIVEGDYSIFDVVDTSFQGVGVYDIKRYQVKEEIHEPLTVNDEIRYQIYVYYKPEGEEWNTYPDSVWTIFNSGGRIVRVQNNVRFVKLTFPFEVGKKWDGNISDTNNDQQQYYEMKQVRRPFSFNTSYFAETVSVVEFDNYSALDDNYSVEVYAKDKGLVYKEVQVYKYDQSNLAAKKVQYGQHYTQKLLAHGKYK